MSFLSDLIRFESGGRNVTNVNQSTSSGQARGLFQITDGTWRDFGRRAGVDFSKYPTALSAPPELQAQVAGMIPLNRWDPITLRKLTAAGHTFDVSKTLAENAAMHGEKMTGDTGRQLSPATANLGPAPKGTAYGEDKSAGAFAGATAGGSVGAQGGGNSLASILGDALGGASLGGGGGGGGVGGGIPSSPLTPAADLRTKGPEVSAEDWAAISGQPPTQLADLFKLPAIGVQKPGVNIAAKSWI